MNRSDAEQLVTRAVDRLLHDDAYLLERDVNERSITHRLAVHLAGEFQDWDVDCEYNRDGHETKRLNLLRKTSVKSDDEHATTVFPDIIIHRRGTDDNLVVIEAKKTTNQDGGEWDKRKLRAFSNPDELGYEVTVFLLFETRPKHETSAELEFSDGRRERRCAPRKRDIFAEGRHS